MVQLYVMVRQPTELVERLQYIDKRDPSFIFPSSLSLIFLVKSYVTCRFGTYKIWISCLSVRKFLGWSIFNAEF